MACCSGRSHGSSQSLGLEQEVARHFQKLSVRGKVLAEYLWIGGTGTDLHSKTKVLDYAPSCAEELPVWHFDGSVTGQASEQNSTVYIKPRVVVPDPFRGGDHILVLCDTFSGPTVETGFAEMKPHPSNSRAPCEHVMRLASASGPVFTVEQQYTLLDPATSWPLGWPERAAMERASLSSYCGVGVGATLGREFAESHFRACLHAGIPVTCSSAEALPGQWSFRVGPCRGLEIGDQLWLARYMLLRCTEEFKVVASLDPKPVPGDWSGNAAYLKISTEETREEGKGWHAIQQQVQLLEGAHLQHLMLYGNGNSKRLTGQHRTSSAMHFTWGLEDRSASIRIPHSAFLHQRGWYEDRRPASNMDPYLVSMIVVCTTLGIALPISSSQILEMSGESGGESEVSHSRGSSAILSELERQESFAPDTPPQNLSLLASECTSRHCPY